MKNQKNESTWVRLSLAMFFPVHRGVHHVIAAGVFLLSLPFPSLNHRQMTQTERRHFDYRPFPVVPTSESISACYYDWGFMTYFVLYTTLCIINKPLLCFSFTTTGVLGLCFLMGGPWRVAPVVGAVVSTGLFLALKSFR